MNWGQQAAAIVEFAPLPRPGTQNPSFSSHQQPYYIRIKPLRTRCFWGVVQFELGFGAFGANIDYAMLVKLYGNDRETEARYSPAECIGCREIGVAGRPDPTHISTSHVERQNLTMRMSMRRFTRLTNAFSKKVDNHFWAIALHYMHYNFCPIHQTLRVTPAMEAGISDHVWGIEEIMKLAEERQRLAA